MTTPDMSGLPDMPPAIDALAEPLVAPGPGAPPDRDLTPRQWIRANLASSPFNIVLSTVFAVFVAFVGYHLLRWVFVTAEWAIVRVNLRLFMVGRFPSDQFWRLWASTYLLAATLGLATALLTKAADLPGEGDDRSERDTTSALRALWPLGVALVAVLALTRTVVPSLLALALVLPFLAGRWAPQLVPTRRRPLLWLVFVGGLVAALLVITVGADGVGWDDWGGLQLTVFATVAGVALAFPLGLLLALGRRSALRGIRGLSVAYIEAFRGVPLVTLLFVGQYMIGFLFPTSIDPPSFLVRAIIAITLFEAAYIAEIVRGGLQAVPYGQVEAAQAVGLSQPKVLRLVVLPQALRAVIPAMVGQFISLFKDTSLLSIVGFFELLTVAESVTSQDQFLGQGLSTVTLAFVGFLYWAGCSTMAKQSRRLEQRLGVGSR